jgi:peptide deformylase
MAVRDILRFPDARLRQRSAEVGEIDDSVRQLVADMAETMAAANGAGLAAIQVGEPLRIFIIEGGVAEGRDEGDEEVAGDGAGEARPPKVFINPEIVEVSQESQTGDEGCLSFPGIYVPVKRGMRAKVRAMGLDGNTFEVDGAALFARALQHENDHLNGRLLIDQVGPVKRELIKRKLRKDLEAERDGSESATG